MAHSLDEFVRSTQQKERREGVFKLESPRMLEVNLDGTIWIKTGSMVAYVGTIQFEREGALEHGVSKMLKRAVTGEGARLTKATGQGRLYLADKGKSIQILQLQHECLYVNGNDLLAFEPGVTWDIQMMKKLTALMAGGLFNIKLEGSGRVAISTHHEPMTLMVHPGQLIRTDPNATVAWSGSLKPEFRTDVSFKTLLGRGSGESFQMEFAGDGFVVIQPYEEIVLQPQT